MRAGVATAARASVQKSAKAACAAARARTDAPAASMRMRSVSMMELLGLSGCHSHGRRSLKGCPQGARGTLYPVVNYLISVTRSLISVANAALLQRENDLDQLLLFDRLHLRNTVRVEQRLELAHLQAAQLLQRVLARL